MPRIVFDNWSDLNKWAEEFLEPDRFVIYATSHREIICEPRRSTEPRRWGYVHFREIDEFQRAARELEGMGYTVLRCSRYDWASDRAVEAHGPQGEGE